MEEKLAYSEVYSLFKDGEADFDIETLLKTGNCNNLRKMGSTKPQGTLKLIASQQNLTVGQMKVLGFVVFTDGR